jgi:class 3 adenylate cyclase
LGREQRRLAAILAADAVGYSRLMGRDEAGTLARLKDHLYDRLEPALLQNGGRLVKLTGDGVLAEFKSAVDAIRAAIEFQQAVVEANRPQSEDARILFRVGLHLGDLIVDEDDLYGDGVNIAARLQAEAPSGGILISRTVHEAVLGKVPATYVNLGPLELKNIERPIDAFEVRWIPSNWIQPNLEQNPAPSTLLGTDSLVGAWLSLWTFEEQTTPGGYQIEFEIVKRSKDRSNWLTAKNMYPRSSLGRGYKHEIHLHLGPNPVNVVGTWRDTDATLCGSVAFFIDPALDVLRGKHLVVAPDNSIQTGHWFWLRIGASSSDMPGRGN